MRKVYLGLTFLLPYALMAQMVDSIDNITFRIGKGWEVKKEATFTLLTYFDNPKKSFCQLAVYLALPSSKDKKQDFQTEWKELVEKNFTVFTLAQPATMKTKFGTTYQRLGAKATDKNGNSYYIQLNVFDCGNVYQSVMAVSTTQKQLQVYDSLWQGLITKISKNKSGATQSTSTPTNSATTTSTGTASASNQLVGPWGKSASSPSAYSNGVLTNLAYSGYTKGEYNFNADGTYNFQGESWSGYLNSTEYRLIDESGRYTVSGNGLSIAPTKSLYRVVDKEGKLKKSENIPLAKRNYTWQTYYFEGIQQTELILTSDRENPIDGGFSSNSMFPNSFIYSPGKKLEFKFLPLNK